MPSNNVLTNSSDDLTSVESSMATSSSTSSANSSDASTSVESSMAASSSTSSTIIHDSYEDTLRIYCCGTNFDENNRGELISELYHYDNDNNPHPENIMVLKGAGKAGHSSTFKGLADGYKDMTTNASAARSWVYNHLKKKVIDEGKNEVNILLSGWSRGAITAFLISNEIDEVITQIRNECDHEDNLTINVKLFAVDPVAGPTNGERRRLAQLLRSEQKVVDWDKMYTLGKCVKNAEVFYANDEQRTIMKPVYGKERHSETKVSRAMVPGEHSSLVQANDQRFEDSINIVCKSAEVFYKANGIAQDTSRVFEFARQKAEENSNSPLNNIRSHKTPAKRQTSSFTLFNAFKNAHETRETPCPERNKVKNNLVSNMHVEKFKQFKEVYSNSEEWNQRVENRFNPNASGLKM